MPLKSARTIDECIRSKSSEKCLMRLKTIVEKEKLLTKQISVVSQLQKHKFIPDSELLKH